MKIIEEQYQKVIAEIDEQIDVFIRRYAVNDKLSSAEAYQYLSEGEFAKFKMDLDEYIRLGQENAVHYSADIARDLERASLEYRITRLAALEVNLKAEIASIYGLTEEATYQALGEMYPDLYGRTAFEIFKGLGVMDTTFTMPSMDIVDMVIRTPWAADGQNFSTHLWRDQTLFIHDLMDTLSEMFMNGYSYKRAARILAEMQMRPLSDCKRVIYTEAAFFQGLAQNNCYRDLGVERYQFFVELNVNVCEKCSPLDGKIFKLDERRIGVNAIPMHPNCRCVEVPYINHDNMPDYVAGFRNGRDLSGRSVLFPEDMTYQEWYEQIGRTLESENV